MRIWAIEQGSARATFEATAAAARAAATLMCITAGSVMPISFRQHAPLLRPCAAPPLQQVLLERLHSMELETGPSNAAVATTTGAAAAAAITPPALAAGRRDQQQLFSSCPSAPCSSLPRSAAVAAAGSCAGAGDRPLGFKTPPRASACAKLPGSRSKGRLRISEPSMGGGIDDSGKLSGQSIVQELEVMFG